MATVALHEKFVSIQGESTHAGLPCFFIRLSGCNLRCSYCDTPEAYAEGHTVQIAELVKEAEALRVPLVEITGGEPLLQDGFRALAEALAALPDKTLLVETNGTQNISILPAAAVAVMDVKCPGSDASENFDAGNLARLRPHDEVKFVIASKADFAWACRFIRTHHVVTRCHAVHIAPAADVLAPSEVAAWVLEEGLPIRMQIQLHKLLHMP